MLLGELQKTREHHRDEIRRLSDSHDTRLRECTDRVLADTSPLPRPALRREPGDVGRSAVATAATTLTPVALAVVSLADKWRAYAGQHCGTRRGKSALAAAACSQHRSEAESFTGGQRNGGDKGGIKSKGQLLVETFLRETVVRLDAECARAVRHARVLEWELHGARQEAVDVTAALEEARVEGARWSARVAVAEAALIAASQPAGGAHRTYADPTASAVAVAGGTAGDFNFGASVPGGRGGTRSGAAPQGSCTAASVSLLEKRLAAAMGDLVVTGAARAAAEAGEAAATARAEEAQGEAMAARATADMLGAELERHKASVSGAMVAEATEWRREIRSELGRWWNDDLVSFLLQ